MKSYSEISDDEQIDLDAVRAKYKFERDKRIRSEGNDQYQEVTGDFAYFIDDPYTDTALEREAQTRQVCVAIIGGGFGGMLSAVRLLQAGIDDIVIIEKGGGFGGTWYWNRYPGASCDIESYIYFPLMEETGFIPNKKYTTASETLAYCEQIAKKFGLHDKALLQTEVVSTEWRETERHWLVETDKGDALSARFIVNSNGPLNRPKLPAIQGISEFEGHTFHTSRWDYSYTGGNSEGGLTKLKDKRVAIIGTGATAIQCVPHLGASAKQLYVFQRTPSSVEERNNIDTDVDWLKSQQPGWHEKRRRNFEKLLFGQPVKEDLVADGWTDAFRNLFGGLREKVPSKKQLVFWSFTGLFHKRLYSHGLRKYLTEKSMAFMNIQEEMELADFRKMERIRNRVDNIVNDEKTAEQLKPYYRLFCKRPCFHDEYLSTFNRSNVELLDTNGQGVERITKSGIILNNTEYPVDCIIFATGFEVGTDYARRAGYQIFGADGLSISDKWRDGVKSLHGMHVNGFPNAFFFGPTQSGFSANFTYALDQQSQHVAYIVSEAQNQNFSRLEAEASAEEAWVRTIISKARDTEEFQAACTPGYYNNEGHGNRHKANMPYGGGPVAFFDLLASWRRKGTLDGLDAS